MGWHYKIPQSFPAMYPVAIRTAVENLNEGVVLAYGSPKEVQIVAEKLRYFRWCVRYDPTADREFFNIFDIYDIRTSTVEGHNGVVLYITAKPTKVSEFIRLNPDLAKEVMPIDLS